MEPEDVDRLDNTEQSRGRVGSWWPSVGWSLRCLCLAAVRDLVISRVRKVLERAISRGLLVGGSE